MADFNRFLGKTGFDHRETKLPTYWNTPFSKICLGMKIGQQIDLIVINRPTNSLYSLIADGHYRSPSQGQNTWKSLIGSHASLQTNCNKGCLTLCWQPWWLPAKRGLVGNIKNECVICDSNTTGSQAIITRIMATSTSKLRGTSWFSETRKRGQPLRLNAINSEFEFFFYALRE